MASERERRPARRAVARGLRLSLARLAGHGEHRDSSRRLSCLERQAPASRCWHGDDGRELEVGRSRRRKLLGERAATVELPSLDTQYQRAAVAQFPQDLHADAPVRALAAAVDANSGQLLLPPDIQAVVVEEVSDKAGRRRRGRYPREPGQPGFDTPLGLVMNRRRFTAGRRREGRRAYNTSRSDPIPQPGDRRQNGAGERAKVGSKARPVSSRSDHRHVFEYT